MEQELLFKGKCIHTGFWADGGISWNAEVGKAWIGNFRLDGEWREVDPATVGQFVGKPDKLGTKIFAGDLVLVNGYETPHTVKWHEDNLCYYLDHDHEDCIGFGDVNPEDMEIVGSIHDNNPQP